MKAFVLCAGLGTRLKPVTDALPKPALPMLGVPLVQWTFAHLAAQGVDGFVINTHHLPQEMEAAARAAATALKLPLEVSHEPVIQGTGGALREAARFLPTDAPFVLWNGDILSEIDLKDALAAHQASGASATMVLRPMPPNEKYGAVELDGYHGVRRIAGNGPGGAGLTNWHFTGVHIVEPSVVKAVPASGEACINRQVYISLIANGGRVHGHVVQSGYWSDLGTPARYISTQAELLHGALDFNKFPGVSPLWPPSRGGIWQQHGSKVARGVSVIPPVWIGPNAIIEQGARLGPNAAVNGKVPGTAELVDGALISGELADGEKLHGAVRLRTNTAR
ncbi:MAG: NTP transferase domain-containing protein [Deltaproteobacteria bacterium]|nr:NTP transferase domain-containing protein [Deltaproteobacteria bacterium]